MLLFLRFFVSIMAVFCPCSGDGGFLHAYSHGDIIIGGLFPIHKQTSSLSCTHFDFQMFLRTEVMIYAIREINQRRPRVLPNLTIEYDMLVTKFNWRTVAVVGSDEHGRYDRDYLKDPFSDLEHICIEFILILPDNFSWNNSQNKYVADLMSKINKSSAESVILFTGESNVAVVFEAAIKHKLNRTWIATNMWSTSNMRSALPGIKWAEEVFGFVSKGNEVPGFKDYVNLMLNGTSNDFLEHYRTHYAVCFDQSEENGESNCPLTNSQREQCQHPSCLAKYIDQDTSYDIYLAVEVIAGALRRLLKCCDHHCECSTKCTALEVTACNCSKTCKPGKELKKLSKSGCYYCIPCADEEFSHGKGDRCKLCKAEQYSSEQKNTCIDKTVDFLKWSEPFVGILGALAGFGVVVTITFAVLFIVYWGTPVVKAVGGYLCLLELLSLLLCFCLTFSFAGKPTDATCMVGMPLFGIAFSFCIACILANLLQISLAFSFEVNAGSWPKRLHQPVALVTMVTGIQVALCVTWVCLNPPHVIDQETHEGILKQCDKGSNAFFFAMLAYTSFLSFVCFGFAVKGRNLPDLYINARLITSSMLLFLFVWVFVIPIYIHIIRQYKRAIESTAMLFSCYSILGFHLAPKCYIMVFRKELNNTNAIIEYIRKNYEQSHPPVVTAV